MSIAMTPSHGGRKGSSCPGLTKPSRQIPGYRGKPEAVVGGLIRLLICPAGAGKSMLARRLTTILPAMTLAEAIETTRIHSVAGLTGAHAAFVTTGLLCPYSAPHHIG
jgi:predicted ATPase with chaperone activity